MSNAARLCATILGLWWGGGAMAQTVPTCAAAKQCPLVVAKNPARCLELEQKMKRPADFVAGGQIQLDRFEKIVAEWMGDLCYRRADGDLYVWQQDTTARDTGPASPYAGQCFDCMPPGSSGAVIFIRDNQSFSTGWFTGWRGAGGRIDWPAAPSNPLTSMGDGGQGFCLNCHGSTTPGSTFASMNKIDGHPATFLTQMPPQSTQAPTDDSHHRANATPLAQLTPIDARVTNAQGVLTTSFLWIIGHPKDNRLQPLGFLPEPERIAIAAALGDRTPIHQGPGFPMDENLGIAVGPEGEAARDPDYQNGYGKDRLRYVVQGLATKPARVTAQMYYQSIPPFCQQDRYCTATKADGTPTIDTERLQYLAVHLDLDETVA